MANGSANSKLPRPFIFAIFSRHRGASGPKTKATQCRKPPHRAVYRDTQERHMTRGNTGPSVAKDQGIKDQARKSTGDTRARSVCSLPKKVGRPQRPSALVLSAPQPGGGGALESR